MEKAADFGNHGLGNKTIIPAKEIEQKSAIHGLLQIVKFIKRRVSHCLPASLSLVLDYRLSLLRKEILGKHITALLTESYNGRLLVDPLDSFVGRALASLGEYDRETLEYHLSYLSSRDKVLVVGANVGALLVPLAQKVNFSVGIEANPRTFNLLQLNIKLNKLANVELHNIAAGDKEEEVGFIMNRHNPGGSKIKMGLADKRQIYQYDFPQIAQIQMRRLDQLLETKAYDLIIMDIEGAEYRALRGMKEILHHSRRLQVEVSGAHLRDLAQVTPEQFAAELGEYFQKAFILEDREHMVRHEDFSGLIERICQRETQQQDVIFLK